MPNYAFVLGEAVVTVTATGMAAQIMAFVTDMDIDKQAVLLEDGSVAMRQLRLGLDTVWVDDDVTTIQNVNGPFNVYVLWTNQDDLRLRSEGIQNALLKGITGRGSLSGGPQTWRLSFEGYSLEG